MFRHQFSYYYFLFVVAVALIGVLLLPVAVLGNDQASRYAPGDHLSSEQVHVYEDKVILEAEGALWAEFEASDSMVPFFDERANALQIRPKSSEDIHVGDIISYSLPGETTPIIHRVIAIGEDDQGTYYVVQGDNNPVSDPETIRFKQIRSVVIAIIY